MVLGTNDLFELFECSDIEALLFELRLIGVRPHVRNGSRKHVFVSTYELPVELRERATQIAVNSLMCVQLRRGTAPRLLRSARC
jgi:hypothetical protein